jgi:hypothetical protein
MRWEDEQFVKVYVRDTGDWLALGWEAQALFLLLLRKADRAGVLRAGRAKVRGLAALAGMPLEVVERALPALLEDGCLQECEGGYIIPNYIEAQEARQTDRARKQLQRERDRDTSIASGQSAMARDALDAPPRRESHGVTRRHTASHGVTLRLDETRRDESNNPPLPPSGGDGDEETSSSAEPEPQPACTWTLDALPVTARDGLPASEWVPGSTWTLPDAVDAVHREVQQRPYPWGERDDGAARLLMAHCAAEGIPRGCEVEEIARRWGRALVRNGWKFEPSSGKAVTLRQLAVRECWARNADPPMREEARRDGLSGAARMVRVAVEPWAAVLERHAAPGVPDG